MCVVHVARDQFSGKIRVEEHLLYLLIPRSNQTNGVISFRSAPGRNLTFKLQLLNTQFGKSIWIKRDHFWNSVDH